MFHVITTTDPVVVVAKLVDAFGASGEAELARERFDALVRSGAAFADVPADLPRTEATAWRGWARAEVERRKVSASGADGTLISTAVG